MNQLKITPDIAELIGAYREGARLTNDELQMVQSFLTDSDLYGLDFDTNLIPDAADDCSIPPVMSTELLSGTMVMDCLGDNNYFEDMATHSIIGDVIPCPNSMDFEILQQQSDTCAIKSQQIVMHSFGIDINESVLTAEAAAKGYYVHGHGSVPDKEGLLLEDHGIGTHTKTHATVYDLAAELSQGHKVIVGVDADELWRPSFINDLFGEQANHALLVTGIDTSNPLDVCVIVTDPGTGEVARSYPMSQFMDAWHDSSCLMIATDEAPQISYDGVLTNPEMVNFDYAQGHIPYVGNIPYDTFTDILVPHFDAYFDHHLADLHSDMDYRHFFNDLDDIYDHFENHFSMNDMDDSNTDIDTIFNLFC